MCGPLASDPRPLLKLLYNRFRAITMQKKSKKGLLFELSGEHPKLPRAELESILKTVLNKFYIVSDQNGKTEDISDTSHGSNRLLVIETEEYSSKLINELSIRLAMTHSINEILAHYWVRNKTLADEASMIRNQLVGGLEEFKSLKKGRTFKLTTNRLGTRNRFSKDMIKTISASIIRELSETMRVNVTDPDVEIVLFITDELFLVEKLCDINRSAFETRKPQLMPYFAPISIHPRMARC